MNKMIYKGFSARIMEAKRLIGKSAHGLPPGNPVEIYNSDEFIEYPEKWMKGPGVFIVPVRPEKGLWFDWRDNDKLNTAVLPTIKGCNPITGLQTSGFHLEQYENKCPRHRCEFIGDRFCPECDYKWMPQNYISYPNTLWWDTWNTGDGIGRQFFFTEESLRDVAPRLIGKENTMPAFGFAFYTPKKIREPEQNTRCVKTLSLDSMSLMSDFELSVGHSSHSKKSSSVNNISSPQSMGGPISPPQSVAASLPPDFSAETLSRGITIGGSSSSGISEALALREKALLQKTVSEEVQKDIPSKKESIEVSIGAGAKIRQPLNEDPYPLESWKETPDAVMTIYFIFNNEFEELRAKGMRDLSGNQEGMLKGLPVG